jgi:hypothetical protein
MVGLVRPKVVDNFLLGDEIEYFNKIIKMVIGTDIL